MRAKLTILYEDQDILVCFKPHGLATQSKRAGSPDLERMILTHLTQTTKSAGRPYLAVIHRLDQPVAGLLVFAKNKAAAASLSKQLTTDGFGKYYLALVDGVPTESEGTLRDYLVKDSRTNLSSVCTPDTPGAKEALLSYKVTTLSDCVNDKDSKLSLRERQTLLQEFTPKDQQTLLEVHLGTGRHHQIRVQLSHMGCPIVGDVKYNPKPVSERSNIRLCAYKLCLKHPKTNETLFFQI